jgi:hypothetical protein
MTMGETWEEQTKRVRARAFEPLPANAVRGLGQADPPGKVRVLAREWRLRRAVELLIEAGEVGIGQAMLADLVANPVDSPLWQDLEAVGATSSLEERQDKRGTPRTQRVWRLIDPVNPN